MNTNATDYSNITFSLPTDHLQILNQELARRKKKNPRYSLRAFAHHLGLDPSALSRILGGKQEISLISARKVVQTLKLNSHEKFLFLSSVVEEKKQKINAFLIQEGSVVSDSPSCFKSHSSNIKNDPYFGVKKIRLHLGNERLTIVQKILQTFFLELAKLIQSDFQHPNYEIQIKVVPLEPEVVNNTNFRIPDQSEN